MVITVISVATPMVSPMVVNTARSLCWRKASMLWLRLSARFNMSRYLNAFPFLTDTNNVLARKDILRRKLKAMLNFTSFWGESHRSGLNQPVSFRNGWCQSRLDQEPIYPRLRNFHCLDIRGDL